MNTVNKNQHTLYRFVSLRNPELSKKEDQKKRFVFHPESSKGIYFTGMLTKTDSQTKWEKLQQISTTFAASAYKSTTQVEALMDKEFLEFSILLSRNKSSLDYTNILRIIETLKVLDPNILELAIWDNLFYQVVTQKNFYIKELLMQILVAISFIKQLKSISVQSERITAIPLLAQARVVLPTILFEEENTITNNPTKPEILKAQPTLEEKQIVNRDTASQITVSLETLTNEIKLLEFKYEKEYSRLYKIAYDEYESITKPLIDEYNLDYNTAKNLLCDVIRPENFDPNDYCNQPDVPYPTLPKFSFEYLQKTDEISLQEQLSADSFIALQRIKAEKDNESYQEILDKIQVAIDAQQEIILQNTNFETPVLLIGGVAITSVAQKTISSGQDNTINPAFVPERFGVRNIGIADYKKVVSHVCCYDAGEVSHIENIMAKELRSKTTTREQIEEFTQTDQTSQEKENLSDTSTTDRFEMQTEISKLIAEDKQFASYANYSGKVWGGTLDVGANYATNSSKEESNRQAITQAKDITNRAMERIVSRISRETIKKTTEKFTETNDHVFDNTLGENHVSGVYRFINAIYKNQVLNYGKRMMYEFMIPQPSKLHSLGLIENKNSLNAVKLSKPVDPRENGLINASSVNASNANFWASKFAVEIKPFPQSTIYINKTFANAKVGGDELFNETVDLQIPENYYTVSATLKLFCKYDGNNRDKHAVGISFGNINLFADEKQQSLRETNLLFYTPIMTLNNFKDKISVSYAFENYHTFNFALSIKCNLVTESLNVWKRETFNTIIAAYEAKLADYYASLSDNQTSRESNPGFYRQIEQLVLRKNCISYLMDEAKMGQGFYEFTDSTKKDLANFHIIQNQAMDNYSSLVKFMEQAFEWNLISYNFYPFYWGNRNDWSEMYQYECNDPLFRNFMQSGMARVIVTVKPGFENAVLHFMATNQIWNGGEIPVLGNPLYLSIVDELKEQEYTIEETWETVVPTSLIGLQKSGVAINEEGLPCGLDCIDLKNNSFITNATTLGKTTLPTR